MGWKSVRKGTNVNEALVLPEKNGGWTGKRTCKSVEWEENHKKGPRCSWARNQMGNHSSIPYHNHHAASKENILLKPHGLK